MSCEVLSRNGLVRWLVWKEVDAAILFAAGSRVLCRSP